MDNFNQEVPCHDWYTQLVQEGQRQQISHTMCNKYTDTKVPVTAVCIAHP